MSRTKKEQNMIDSYYRSIMYYGLRSIWDCYSRPSSEKVFHYEKIVDECIANNGYELTIVSYNTYVFTVCYKYKIDNTIIHVFHTPYYKHIIM